jgi:hypothetical protein
MAIKQPFGLEPPPAPRRSLFLFFMPCRHADPILCAADQPAPTRWGDEGLKNVTRRMVARQREPERYFAAQVGISSKTAFLADCRMLDQ